MRFNSHSLRSTLIWVYVVMSFVTKPQYVVIILNYHTYVLSERRVQRASNGSPPHSPSETIKVELGFVPSSPNEKRNSFGSLRFLTRKEKSLKEPTLYCFGSPKWYKAEATSRCFGGNRGLLGAEAS